MIGCPCGGFTVPASERRRGLVLRFECCGACGRCARWRLDRDGRSIADGEPARRQYRAEVANSGQPHHGGLPMGGGNESGK